MTGVYQRVSPGNALDIPASVWNELLGVAEANRFGRASGAVGIGSGPGAGVVRVKNSTGSDLERFEAATVAGPVFDPTGSADQRFAGEALLELESPTRNRATSFAVAAERIPAGKIGLAKISGVVVGRVRLAHELDSFVTTRPGNPDLYTSSHQGSPLLWIEGGSSAVRWALFELSPSPSRAITARLGDAIAVSGEVFQWRYPWAEVAFDSGLGTYLNVGGGRSSKTGGAENSARQAINRLEHHPVIPEVDGEGYVLLGDCQIGEPEVGCPPARVTVMKPLAVPSGLIVSIHTEQGADGADVFAFEALNPTLFETRANT